MQLDHFEDLIAMRIAEIATSDDPAHDFLHFERVVKMAKKLCQEENGRLEIVMLAAWLHGACRSDETFLGRSARRN